MTTDLVLAEACLHDISGSCKQAGRGTRKRYADLSKATGKPFNPVSSVNGGMYEPHEEAESDSS